MLSVCLIVNIWQVVPDNTLLLQIPLKSLLPLDNQQIGSVYPLPATNAANIQPFS